MADNSNDKREVSQQQHQVAPAPAPANQVAAVQQAQAQQAQAQVAQQAGLGQPPQASNIAESIEGGKYMLADGKTLINAYGRRIDASGKPLSDDDKYLEFNK